jgi:hypothetical protein
MAKYEIVVMTEYKYLVDANNQKDIYEYYWLPTVM